MKTATNNEKTVFLDIIKDGLIIPVVVRPETRVEDILIANGLEDYRLGFQTKGPFLRNSEPLFLKVHRGDLLVCIMYAD
jgi:hypothetical protein